MPTSPSSSRQIGDYEQIRKIGSGGMGRVYLARHRQNQAVVALKILHRKYAKQREPLARFLTEARVVQQLAHPNIVSLHEASDGSGGSDPFIALEYVEGASLASAFGKSWEPGEVLRLIGEAGGALDAVHSQEIIHRDIKPSNIMIRSDGRLKLVDFGLARLLARPAAEASRTILRTRPGAFLGTVKYTSPECARGQEAGFASDIFSLGVVFYQLATGVHPFEADTEARVLEAIRTQAPIRPRHFNPAITAALEDLLMAMLARDASARPAAAQIVGAASAATGPRRISTGPRARGAQPALVGRHAERATFQRLLDAAASGEGTMICISGEAGFGKTMLAESVLGAARGFLVARGRCSERLDGAGPAGANLAGSEAYLPVLESLGELLRGEIAGPASNLLQRSAPAWHAWMSGAQTTPISPAVLKEQYVTFLRALAEDRPVALFLDDLHWSDVSTTDLLNYLAGRIDGTRLAIVATYRPSDLALSRHPFARVKSELASRDQCHEVPLGSLTRDDIEAYIAAEYPENNFPPRFSEVVHRVTGGIPLFLAGILRDVRSRGAIEQHGGVWQLMSSIGTICLELPSSTAEVIARRIARLSERERELLLAAAAQGMEFDSAVAARVLGKSAAEIEDTLLDLDRFHRLVALSRDRDLPDGTPTRTYAFVHVLYHEQLYAGMTQSRRIELSTGVAEALQAFHGERAGEIAASLGFLYRTARKPLEALPFFVAAADAARRLTAHSEAANFARLALEMLEKLPAGPERDARELSVRLLLGSALMATRSYANPEVLHNYARAGDLIGDRDTDPQFFPIRLGQWATNIMSSRMLDACRMAEDLIAFSERADTGRRNILLSGAYMAHGLTLTQMGKFVQATRQLEHAIACDAASNSAGAMLFPLAPGVGSRAQLGLNYWYLGYPDRGISTGLEGIRAAGTDAYGRAFAQMYLAGVHQMRGELEIVADLSSRAMAIAEKPEHRYTEVFHWSSIRHGWAVAKLGNLAEGAAEMRESLAANKANGSKAARAHFLSLMAWVLIEFDRLDEAYEVVEETLATIAETSSRFYLSEALRLKGELCLRRTLNAREAAQLFSEGLAVAREPEQSCRGFELRLLMSLARLGDFTGGAGRESRLELEALLNEYDEGLGTSDLIEARELLELQSA